MHRSRKLILALLGAGLLASASAFAEPAVVRALDGQHWLDQVGGFGNCHGQAAYFLGLSPLLTHDEDGALFYHMARFSYHHPKAPELCEEVEHGQVKEGDVGVILASGEENAHLHSFTFLTKDTVFSKNGHNATGNPYRKLSLDEVADEYFKVQALDSGSTLNKYREGLEQGMDCVRGNRATKTDCVDNELPALRIFRCPTLDTLEKKYKKALSPEYFAVKEAIWTEGKAFAKDRNSVLRPAPLSKKFLVGLDKAQAKEEALMEQDPADPTPIFFWGALRAAGAAMRAFLTPGSKLRQVAFPPAQ